MSSQQHRSRSSTAIETAGAAAQGVADSQQAWKVNFHWENMHDLIAEAKGLGALAHRPGPEAGARPDEASHVHVEFLSGIKAADKTMGEL